MAFNSLTYRANRDEKLARKYLAKARAEKSVGDPSGRVAHLVTLARLTWRVARGWRAMREAQS